jgi:hypothetical protein
LGACSCRIAVIGRRSKACSSSSTGSSTLAAALAALAAEGLPLGPRAAEAARAAPALGALQRLTDAIDGELCQLDRGPALVTLEERPGWSRRTVALRVREIGARYGTSALTGSDWRSSRDFYRLLLGTVFASHRAATTQRLAALLGYSSPAALCHAFANAGLASPAVVGARAREG